MNITTEAPTLTIRRAAWALLMGSLLGAALIELSNFVPILVFAREEFFKQWQPRDVDFVALIFAVTWLIFSVGLSVVGVPLWWICHRLGWRTARAALALGFLATFFVSLSLNAAPWPNPSGATSSYGDSGGMIVTEGHLTSYGWYRTLWESAEFALLGAVVGGVVWRLAYVGPSVRWTIIPGRE